MKELSIEEKAKAYDEAIKRAKEYHTPDCHTNLRIAMENLFPELKESDNTDIRTEIKNIITYFYGSTKLFIHLHSKEELLTWLEKQAEQRSADIDNKFIKMRETKPKDISEFLDRLTTVEQEFFWEHIAKIRELDKEEQSKQKPQGKSVLEATKEEKVNNQNCIKPNDKVEPKFKVKKGKWYVCTNTFVSRGKIIAIKGQTYQSQQEDDTITCEDKCLFIDRHDGKASDYFRYWTIQDAKDGDVLAVEPIEGYSSSFVAIYKKQNKEDFDSYCFVGFDGIFSYGENGHSVENIHPATKEQRNILFQKMKEAGYEWDAEKKELKKIERKIAWGEEDEKTLNAIALFLSSIDYLEDPETWINWLKSLKDRITLLPIEEVLTKVGLKPYKDGDQWCILLGDNIQEGICGFGNTVEDALYAFLKDLITSQSEQKPTTWSEEDEKILNLIIARLHSHPNVEAEEYGKDYHWFKSIKERYAWKPSEAQMVVLNDIIINGHLSNANERILKGLQEQLKKLMGNSYESKH